MEWLGLLAITVPYAIIIVAMCVAFVRASSRPKPKKKPDLKLIKGGKYYEGK